MRSVFRPSGPVNLEAGKKYTISVSSSDKDTDVEQDPAFDVASLAVATNIPEDHDRYLYGLPKQGVHER